MNNILLLSEDTLKSQTSLNENVFGKNIKPAIRTAQEINLQSILGSSLYNKILELVQSNGIGSEEYAAYKTLLDDYIQSYLCYEVLAYLVNELSVKLTNLGTVVSNDEHITNLTQNERDLLYHQYIKTADSYANMLQKYLLAHKTDFAELDEKNQIVKPNLDSTEDSGLWLGGSRGYIIRGKH